MKIISGAIWLALSSAVMAFEPVATITGTAHAVDGDGVGFGKIDVRLRGIAAPEDNRHSSQPGGAASRLHLAAMIDGREVICELDGTVANKRPVGVCFVDGININHHQVASGYARDCPAYSDGIYRSAELTARQAGHDLSAKYPLPDYCGR